MKTTKTIKTMQKGGSKTPPKTMDEAFAKRYPNYFGKGTAYDDTNKSIKKAVKGAKTVAKTVIKASPSYKAAKGTDDFLEKRYPNYFGKGTMYNKVKKGIKSVFQDGGTVKPVPKKPVFKAYIDDAYNTNVDRVNRLKSSLKKPVPKKVVPASSSNMKTFRLKNGYDTNGGKVEKMQKGGSVDGPMEARRKIMGEKKPSLKKTLNYVKKNGSGLILKDKSKLQEGTYKPTMQKGGVKK